MNIEKFIDDVKNGKDVIIKVKPSEIESFKKLLAKIDIDYYILRNSRFLRHIDSDGYINLRIFKRYFNNRIIFTCCIRYSYVYSERAEKLKKLL